MNAIILTEDQAADVLAANVDSHLTLEPRRLNDGRLILNADVLDDPYFTDRARPWATALGLTVQDIPADESAIQVGGPASVDLGETVVASAPTTRNSALPIVTLTEADLA